MARIKLERFEAEEGDLPDICMKCGARATTEKLKRFSWQPPWVYVLLLAGLLPFLIVALILTKRMRVPIPLCAEHRRHWTWRGWLVGGGFFAIFLLGLGTMILLSATDNGPQRREDAVFGFVCFGFLGLALVWLIVAAIVQHTAIRPTQITDYDITLTNVAPGFVKALLEEDREGAERRARRRQAARTRRPRGKSTEEYYEREPRRRPPAEDAFEERDE
jgi:hypothetical protein